MVFIRFFLDKPTQLEDANPYDIPVQYSIRVGVDKMDGIIMDVHGIDW